MSLIRDRRALKVRSWSAVTTAEFAISYAANQASTEGTLVRLRRPSAMMSHKWLPSQQDATFGLIQRGQGMQARCSASTVYLRHGKTTYSASSSSGDWQFAMHSSVGPWALLWLIDRKFEHQGLTFSHVLAQRILA